MADLNPDATAQDQSVSVVPPVFAGNLERREGRRIIGWAQDTAAPSTALDMELCLDGVSRFTFKADLSRPDVGGAGFPRLACGFDVHLPDDLPDGAAHELTILLPGGALLAGSPMLLDAGADIPAAPPVAALLPAGQDSSAGVTTTELGLSGLVEQMGPTEVAGWILDPADPQRAVDLCIYVDGDFTQMVLADMERHDVHGAGHPRLNCGFRIPLPESALDGRPHSIRITENDTGAVLPGGEGEVLATFEGVAFIRHESGVLAGWARPVGSLAVRFDEDAPIIVTLDRAVPGLGGRPCGFELAVPPAMADGGWHRVSVEHPVTGRPLDGMPLSFRLDPLWRPVVRDARMTGRRFQGAVTDMLGAPLARTLGVEIDGKRSATVRSDMARVGVRLDSGRADNNFSFPVPPGAKEIVLWDETGPEPFILARWTLADGVPDAGHGQADSGQEISTRTLADPALIAGSLAAFQAFCTPTDDSNPDPLLDAHWYGEVHLGRQNLSPIEALAHYASVGAAAGLSSTPFFDEAEVRRLYPALDAAITAGTLPCAFALYLHLGRGLSLQPLAGVDIAGPLAAAGLPVNTPLPLQALRERQYLLGHDAAMATTPLLPQPDPIKLPQPTAQRNRAHSVYASWMDRLDITPEDRARFEADEIAARNRIRGSWLTTQPLVSIIMPTFNRAYTIGDAIQSALDQTYGNFELLICDDGSYDKTPEVVKQFNDPRIRYMQFTKSNGAETRNKGLGFAQGDYIAYLDSDNLWNPHFLDVMLRQLLDAPGTTLAYCSYLDTEIVGAKVALMQSSHPRFNPIALSTKNFMDLNTIMHHRRAFDWLGGFDKTLPRLQDWDLMLRYTSVFRPRFVDHCLVFYRRNLAWGQVTNLFMNSGAQDFVNQKTKDRLEKAHVRLDLEWPQRGRLVVLAAEGPGAGLLALSFATMAAPFADVELLADLPAGTALPEGVRLAQLPTGLAGKPARFGYYLSNRIAGAVAIITVGFGKAIIGPLQALLPSARFHHLELAEGGLWLRDAIEPRNTYHIGALPFGIRADEEWSADLRTPLVTLLPLAADRSTPAVIAAQAQLHKIDILIPPVDLAAGPWLRFTPSGGLPEELSFEAGLALALAETRMVVVRPKVTQLSVASFSLLIQMQGAGAPLAVVPDPIADQWITTRCAYRIDVNTPEWIFDKVLKILKGKDGERLSLASLTAWRITHHSELAQERIAAFLQIAGPGSPHPEVLHDRG